MDVSVIAVCVAGISLVSTLVFALLNYRYTKKAHDRADVTENRAAASDARSTERSYVVWDARLIDSGYVLLTNEGHDTAKGLRVIYTILLPTGEHVFPPMSLRSHDPYGGDAYRTRWTHTAVKEFVGPGQAVGLPVPEIPPFSLSGYGDTEKRLGLSLQIEWYTEHGTYKSVDLMAEDLPILISAFEFESVKKIPFDREMDPTEALTPKKTPDDHWREHRASLSESSPVAEA